MILLDAHPSTVGPADDCQTCNQLTGASAAYPASAKELIAHFEAFDELDDAIDEALEALADAATRS